VKNVEIKCGKHWVTKRCFYMSYIGCAEPQCEEANERPMCCFYCAKVKCDIKCSKPTAICDDQVVLDTLDEWKQKINKGKRCHGCGNIYDESDLRTGLDDELYCDECYWERHDICENCEETIWSEDSCYVESMDETLCGDCYNEIVSICDKCGSEVSSDDIYHTSGDRYVCSSCADDMHSCDECNISIEDDDVVETEEGERYCPDCAERKTYICANCGTRHGGTGHEYDGKQYCESCYEVVSKED